MKKIILPVIILLTSTFANAAGIELSANQSIKLASLMKSSKIHEESDGRSSILTAESVSCTLERSVGASCIWKVSKEGTAKVIEQELSEKKSAALYDILASAGLEEELDGRASTYNLSKIECSQERFVELGCVLIK